MTNDDVERSIARWRAKLAEVESSPDGQMQCYYGPPERTHESYCFCGGTGRMTRDEAIADCRCILEALHK